MQQGQNIFLVEDDPNFGTVLKSYLEINNFKVTWVSDGAKAMEAFSEQKFDICLLDVMLPNVDGFTIAKEIKRHSPDVPLIFLTAKKLKDDVLKGFKLGADDYIVKPFDSEVLIFKIKAILKRHENHVEEEVGEYSIGSYLFNPSDRTLLHGTDSQKLSPKEAELLHLLCRKANNVLSREEALKTIWGDDNYFTTRSMDVFIAKIRKYLKEDPAVEINNIHGSGYKLVCPKSS